MALKFNLAKPTIVKQTIDNHPKNIKGTVVKNDMVYYKGHKYAIANPSPNGFKVLYTKANDGILKSINSKYTVLFLANEYRGEHPELKPYIEGLDVLGVIRDDKFLIKEVIHKPYGLNTQANTN